MRLSIVGLLTFAAVDFSGFGNACQAVCIYDGKLYAKTTIEQEFKDASLVIRAKVVSSRVISIADHEEDTGVLYQVKIDQLIKGRASGSIAYYSRRDSGGFYLDADVEYLLFLQPISVTEWAHDRPGAMVVNYSCGQSRPWSQVSRPDRDRLRLLTLQRRSTP
jgi:hypothetical protein